MAKLLTGNEIIVEAALAAGANAFFGYPITPTTEILTGWARKAAADKDLIFLQTEDEPAAGFGVIGAALGGKKSWTATAAAGHVLMQDPLAVAEAMRIPFVAYIGQEGDLQPGRSSIPNRNSIWLGSAETARGSDWCSAPPTSKSSMI